MKIAPTYGPVASCILSCFTGALIAACTLWALIVCRLVPDAVPITVLVVSLVLPQIVLAAFIGIVAVYLSRLLEGVICGMLTGMTACFVVSLPTLLSLIVTGGNAWRGTTPSYWLVLASTLFVSATSGAIGASIPLSPGHQGFRLRYSFRTLGILYICLALTLAGIKVLFG